MAKNSYIPLDEQVISSGISRSYESDFCVHNQGPACSRETITLNPEISPHIQLALSRETLLKAYRLMLQARLTDEKHLKLLKQGKSFFHIGG